MVDLRKFPCSNCLLKRFFNNLIHVLLLRLSLNLKNQSGRFLIGRNFTEDLLKGFESEDSLDNGLVVRTFKIFELLTIEHIVP